ncbi:unnamed protein product [Closterium sp. NIES-65]|nr:unnamed protein product [Closterium sp. NIES-65]
MFFVPHPPSLPYDYVLCSSPALSPHCHGAPPVMEQLLRLVNSLTSPLSSPPLSPHFPSLPTSSHRAPPGDGAAVMEQLFGLVNSLLQAHEGATRRHLAIRTYKVVPFTPSAGLLEWVDGTLPLGEYLLGRCLAAHIAPYQPYNRLLLFTLCPPPLLPPAFPQHHLLTLLPHTLCPMARSHFLSSHRPHPLIGPILSPHPTHAASTRKGGAHARYGGSDWPFMTCREVMARESDKRQAFDKVLQNFHPVMRHFFLERFLLPANWFDRRLTYTRSVAATSMVGYAEGLGDWHAMNILQHLTPVGYVVGLGDRHAMNILVDERSAEVVHIDLGIAFEQGLMLKTPEKSPEVVHNAHRPLPPFRKGLMLKSPDNDSWAPFVMCRAFYEAEEGCSEQEELTVVATDCEDGTEVPFRLTRDIIDGMGVSGVEGVFRRCCETVLAVMRENKEALLTIIEVFIYDPLYKWALSPLKALHRQKMEESEEAMEEEGTEEESGAAMEGNEEATRALLRVKQKLDGFEDGEMRSLAGQVQQLIKDAQDPDRLAVMFPGWGAWL